MSLSSSAALLAALSRFLASPLGDQPMSEAERTSLRAACLEVCSRLETHGEEAGAHKRPRDCKRLDQPKRSDARALEQSALGQSGASALDRDASALDRDASAPAPHGELVLLGSGLKAMAHLTREAMVHLRAADVVFGALQPGGPDRRWLELAIGRPLIDLLLLSCPPETAEGIEATGYCIDGLLLAWLSWEGWD